MKSREICLLIGINPSTETSETVVLEKKPPKADTALAFKQLIRCCNQEVWMEFKERDSHVIEFSIEKLLKPSSTR